MIRLAVRCRPALADAVLAELVELCPNGVEEERGPDWVEYAIYGAEGELPALGSVEAVAGDGLVAIRSEPIPDDWADRWRDFHRPTLVADRVLIRPSWSPPAEDEDWVDVAIDPGQAFGTGAHLTTRLCVELLLAAADRGDAGGGLLDLGTGSGVLAIVGAKLGWQPVRGVDHSQAALAAAHANALANGVTITFEPLDLRTEAIPAAPTLVANLTAPLLRDAAVRLEAAPERLFCSGMLAHEVDGVAAALVEAGLIVRERHDSGDWAALFLTRG